MLVDRAPQAAFFADASVSAFLLIPPTLALKCPLDEALSVIGLDENEARSAGEPRLTGVDLLGRIDDVQGALVLEPSDDGRSPQKLQTGSTAPR
jgi:hypothetical protein